MTVELVEDRDTLAGLWTELAERSTNVFATPEWHSVWWRHLGRGRSVIVVDRERELILPLEVRRIGPLTVARTAGHGPADELGPIGRPGAWRAMPELAAAVAQVAPLLIVDRVRHDERAEADSDGAPASERSDRAADAGAPQSSRPLLPRRKVSRPLLLRREAWPVVDLPEGGFEAYLAARSANFRQQVRRKTRRAVRELGLRFRLAEPATFERDFATLLRLHRIRFGERSVAFTGPREAFHREFAKVALERGWTRLWIAETDSGDAVASLYGFRFAGVESNYQVGRDPTYDRWSLGFVLFARAIAQAAEEGMREYRMLLGDEGYKYRFATRDPGVFTYAFAASPVARLLARGGRAALHLRGRLRRPSGRSPRASDE